MLGIGDVVVSTEPVTLETVLGSCVSVCLWNETSRIGGMNHYMLPEMIGQVKDPGCYGSEAIQRLIDAFLMQGIDHRRLRAKVFGGGMVIKGFHQRFDVGKENVMIARHILRRQGIPIITELTHNEYGIKVLFHSATGRAFVKRLEDFEPRQSISTLRTRE